MCSTPLPSVVVHEPQIEDGMFIASFRPCFRKEIVGWLNAKSLPAFPSSVDEYVPCQFLLFIMNR